MEAAGCDLGRPLGWLGVRSLQEIPLDEARRLVEDGRGRIVQPRGRGGGPTLPHALLLGRDESLPPEALAPGPRLVVLGIERRDVLRLAARLARAGAAPVVVASGEPAELAALAARSTAAAQGAPEAQPRAHDRHPSNPFN
jgi:hypothetical protein